MVIKQDWAGRHVIIPVGGGKPEGRTRISTLAKETGRQGGGLEAWKQAKAIEGVVRNRALYAKVAALISSHDPSKGTLYDTSKSEFAKISEQAMEAAKASNAADTGSAVHAYLPTICAGHWPEFVPDELVGPLLAAKDALANFTVLEHETFVVLDGEHDGVCVAGSFDMLVEFEGRVVVADLKTGAREHRYPLGVMAQCAMYARGNRYHPITGARSPIHPDIDLSTGLLVHLPLAPDKHGDYRCDIYRLDLERGWQAARYAWELRQLARVGQLEKVAA